MSSRPNAAIENLTRHQVQCDADGVMIQVSRQALDQVLTYLAATSAQLSELDAASNACLELCSRHGFATGHGDTVADIIREIDGQIAARVSGSSPA